MIKNQEVIGELQRIAENAGGELRVAKIVEAARAVSNPLHSWFQWDDTAAAQAYRLQQARQLLRVTVCFIGDDQDSVPIRVFVSLTTDRYNGKGGAYRVMTSVLANKNHREQLLADALEDMKTFRERYGALKELANVFQSMSRAQRKLKTSQAKTA